MPHWQIVMTATNGLESTHARMNFKIVEYIAESTAQGKGHTNIMGATGFEPATLSLEGLHSK